MLWYLLTQLTVWQASSFLFQNAKYYCFSSCILLLLTELTRTTPIWVSTWQVFWYESIKKLFDVFKIYFRHSLSDINSICQPPNKYSSSGHSSCFGTLSLAFKFYFLPRSYVDSAVNFKLVSVYELVKINTFDEQSGKVLNESSLSIWVKKVWLVLKYLLEHHTVPYSTGYCYLVLFLRAAVLSALCFSRLHVHLAFFLKRSIYFTGNPFLFLFHHDILCILVQSHHLYG